MRLAVYSDATERGGAEISLRTLLGALDPASRSRCSAWTSSVPGLDRLVATRLDHAPAAAGTEQVEPRPDREPRPSSAEARPDVFQANLRHPWSCQYGLAAALLTRGTKVIAVEHALVSANRPRQRRFKRLTSRRLAAHVSVGRRASEGIAVAIGVPSGSIRVIYTGVELADAEPAPARRASS